LCFAATPTVVPLLTSEIKVSQRQQFMIADDAQMMMMVLKFENK